MAASLGRLTLDLVAKIGNFTEPMAQAERQAKDSSNSIADSFSVASVAAKALGVAVAGISAGGMVAFANQAIDTGSEIKKLSQLANASIHDFQYYSKGAETAGISMESFADKMKDMQDRIGDFQQSGGGPLVDFFDNIAPRVGVTIQQFQKLSGPAALQLYYDSLQKVNATHNDVKFYLEAIISDSSLLVPLLQNGGEGFKKWGDAAERANAIMSDEMVETLAIAKENVRLLNLQWEGLQATLVNNVVPVAQTVVANMDAITNTMIIGGAFIAGTYIPALISSAAAGYVKTKQIVEQTAIQYAAINAERAAAASSLAQAEAQLVNTQSTLAALAAEKALEVQRMQAQINSAGRAASTTRMAQLRQIEVQVTAELTAAETALAAARARTTAATAASVGVGRATLGILGGPVGIGVTLAAVAAGYLLMSDGAEKATASINIQGQSVAELVKKYRELNTLQRDSEVKALADQVEELSLKYRVASSDLYSFMEALPISDEKIATFRKLNSQLSQGRISSNEYYEAVKAVNILTDDQIDKVNRLITAYDEKKAALNQGKAAQDALKTAISKTSEKTQENTRHNQENTKSITDRASAIANLTQKQRAVVKGIDSEIAREKYIAANMKNGWSRERAGYFADKREESGMAFTETASKVWFLQVEAGYKLSQQTKAREESEKKIEESQRKQLEHKEKNYSYSKAELKMLGRVSELSARYDLDGIGARHGIPKGYLAGLMAQESGGNPNAISETGAIGYYQTTSGYRKDNGISVADSKNLPVIAEVVAKNLAKAFEKLGTWESAIRAHNAGVTGSKQFKETGRVAGNAARNREVANFAPSVNKWIVGLGGSTLKDSGFYSNDATENLKDFTEYWVSLGEMQKQAADRQKDLTSAVATEEVRIRSKLAEDIKNIEEANFPEAESRNLISEYQRRANIDIQIAQAAQNDKLASYSDYLKSEEQLINQNYARRQRDLKLDVDFGIEAYTEASLHLEKQRIQELQRARWHALEVQQTMRDAISGLSGDADNIFAKATMSPQDYAKWALDNERSNAQSGLKNERVKVEQDIMTSDAYSTDDERYEALKQAHREYRDGLYAIDLQYDQQVKDLAQQQKLDQINLWSGVLGHAQNTFAQLAQSAKDASGEQSSTYRTMFAMQQAFSVASSLTAAWTAYAQAFADPSAMTLPQKVLGGAAVLAALMPAVTTISSISIDGMAHNGIDNIPREGTWLLDGGERVLNPNQNKDLTKYLNDARGKSQSSTPSVNLNPNFVIVDERESLSDYLYSPDGTKALVRFFKRNRSALGV